VFKINKDENKSLDFDIKLKLERKKKKVDSCHPEEKGKDSIHHVRQ
jgi:hypothetical protein